MPRTHFVSLHQILFHFYHGWILQIFEKTLRVFSNVCSPRMLGILLTSRRLVLRIAAAKRRRIHLTSTENNITMATWIVQVPWYSRIIALLSMNREREKERFPQKRRRLCCTVIFAIDVSTSYCTKYRRTSIELQSSYRRPYSMLFFEITSKNKLSKDDWDIRPVY